MSIQKVAIFGASGNFGAPITAALQAASFTLTIITRPTPTPDPTTDNTTRFPPTIPVLHAAYTDIPALTLALTNHDAVVCVLGPGGIAHQPAILDAALAAGVKRFIVDDFGWGPEFHGLEQFAHVRAERARVGWEYAAGKLDGLGEGGMSWTGIAVGNPIDWALRKFPAAMGFDTTTRTATIYDGGSAHFTGTTLAGIGQAVVGVLQHPAATRNRFVRVLSLTTCQNELLRAFEAVSGRAWTLAQASSTRELVRRGRVMMGWGDGGWVLALTVAQLYGAAEGGSCVVAEGWGESDGGLLGVVEEGVEEVVRKAMGLGEMF